jgi:hypothetical protein
MVAASCNQNKPRVFSFSQKHTRLPASSPNQHIHCVLCHSLGLLSMPLPINPPPPDRGHLCAAVHSWLSSVPSAPPNPKKRRRSCSRSRRVGLFSPSPTAGSPSDNDEAVHTLSQEMDTVTPLRNKKRRTAVDSGDPEATPRPGFGPPAFAQLPPPSRSEGSAASLGQSGHSEASSPSRTSSPSKQLAWLAMHDNGVETRPLRTEQEGLPEALATFVDVLTRVYAGDGIISADHKVRLPPPQPQRCGSRRVKKKTLTRCCNRHPLTKRRSRMQPSRESFPGCTLLRLTATILGGRHW